MTLKEKLAAAIKKMEETQAQANHLLGACLGRIEILKELIAEEEKGAGDDPK